MFNNSPPGAAEIEWYHSLSVSPVSPNIRPMFDVVEDPIIRTPDRSLRELKYTFHEKCSNKKTNILFDGIGFKYSRGRKSLTWRCTSQSKKVDCLAKAISLFKIKHWRICFNFYQLPYQNVKQMKRDGPPEQRNFTFVPFSKKIHTTILREENMRGKVTSTSR